MRPDAARLVGIGVVAAVGLAFGVLLFPAQAPAPEPPPRPRSTAAPAAPMSPTGPTDRDLVPATASAPRPAAAPAPQDELPASSEDVARWQAEDPGGQHAKRSVRQWRALSADLQSSGLEDLVPAADDMAARLDQARRPRPPEEMQTLLQDEIALLGDIDRKAGEGPLRIEVQAIMQGAQNAIQGAPPPDVMESQRRDVRGDEP